MKYSVLQINADASVAAGFGPRVRLAITQFNAPAEVGGPLVQGITVTIAVAAPLMLTVALPGSLFGPAGEQGPPGIQGPPGVGSGSTFVFTQNSPATDWIINHGLNRFPSIEVVDSSGSMVEGDTDYLSSDLIQLKFGVAFSGVAYLN